MRARYAYLEKEFDKRGVGSSSLSLPRGLPRAALLPIHRYRNRGWQAGSTVTQETMPSPCSRAASGCRAISACCSV